DAPDDYDAPDYDPFDTQTEPQTQQRSGYKSGQRDATRQRVQERSDLRTEQRAAQTDRDTFQQSQERPQPVPQAVQEASTAPFSEFSEMEILNLRRHEGSGPTRAFFSVAVHFGKRGKGAKGDPLLLNDCRLVMNKEGEPFVATAQREWTDGQGVRRYSPIFELPKTWRRPLLDAVIDAGGGWPL
ncbi:MAG: hypothetical protein V4671_23485, partial [Armatimonadota bacterium]